METLTKILAVAGGGAVGAVARFLINISPLQTYFEKFPFHTFFINITGSFLIGLLIIFFTGKLQEYENLRLALIVGLLGAYTTFSTFELEIFDLINEREFLTAFGYLFSSVIVGFAGVSLGVWAGKYF